MSYPTWTHTDYGCNRRPTTISVEPSFRDDLGVVFIQVVDGDAQAGIWLDADRLGQMRAALDAAEAHHAASAGR